MVQQVPFFCDPVVSVPPPEYSRGPGSGEVHQKLRGDLGDVVGHDLHRGGGGGAHPHSTRVPTTLPRGVGLAIAVNRHIKPIFGVLLEVADLGLALGLDLAPPPGLEDEQAQELRGGEDGV